MNLVLIDVSSIFWIAWHATADQAVSEAYERTVRDVHKAREGAELCAVCADSPPYFRSEIAPSYKANRSAAPPMALEQFERVKQRLVADGLLIWKAPSYEADDVIATAVRLACADKRIESVTIYSPDKDIAQLVDDARRVLMVSTMSGVRYDEAQVLNKYGVPPRLIADLLALTGDKSDNVPGAKGVGPKKAAALFERFGDLKTTLENADKIEPAGLRDAVILSGADIALSRKLVALRTDAPIDWSELFKERTPMPLNDPEIIEDAEADSAPRNAAPQAPAVVAEFDAPPRQQTAALAVAPPPEWSLALEPASLGAAMKLAQALHNSRLYSRFKNAESIWAVIIRGREMGMGALTALDNFHIVDGDKPAPHAHLLVARAKVHPDCEYFHYVGGDDTYAEYETKSRRNPKATRLKYTIEQARRAGMCPETMRPRPLEGKDSRSQWEKRPDEMLRKTCAVQLARIEYPDATQGLYAVEELEAA